MDPHYAWPRWPAARHPRPRAPQRRWRRARFAVTADVLAGTRAEAGRRRRCVRKPMTPDARRALAEIAMAVDAA
jgi:hypothetical protein